MRYVVLRDDDTNALTPVECLERLYLPFLERGLPVNLAVIPKVCTSAKRPDNRPEGFLLAKNGGTETLIPIGENQKLVRYLLDRPGYRIIQHGYQHTLFEFDHGFPGDNGYRLEHGTQLLQAAGFQKPETFVAPYDRFCRASLREAAERFRVISMGWFELRRLPRSWWLHYALKKYLRRQHWRVNGTTLLAHPGCLLSNQRSCTTMLEEVRKSIYNRRLTVLVTHWWEYFDGGRPNEPFIGVLHETAQWLADQPDVKVISFSDVAEGRVPLA